MILIHPPWGTDGGPTANQSHRQHPSLGGPTGDRHSSPLRWMCPGAHCGRYETHWGRRETHGGRHGVPMEITWGQKHSKAVKISVHCWSSVLQSNIFKQFYYMPTTIHPCQSHTGSKQKLHTAYWGGYQPATLVSSTSPYTQPSGSAGACRGSTWSPTRKVR